MNHKAWFEYKLREYFRLLEEINTVKKDIDHKKPLPQCSCGAFPNWDRQDKQYSWIECRVCGKETVGYHKLSDAAAEWERIK